LVEASSNAPEEELCDQMMEYIEKMSEHYEDGILCDNESQIEKIWKIREGISMATAHNGFVRFLELNLFRQLNLMSVFNQSTFLK